MALLEMADFINILAFVGMTTATYTIFYIGRSMSAKGIGLNMFTLALGINLIGLSHLFRVWLDVSTSPLILMLVATGSVFLSAGIIWVIYDKATEISRLKGRGKEINSVIADLKERYYKKELSEEDLQSAYSNLMREMAEIEVKLKEKRK
ncbi:MAG: hypothetical protein HYS62_01880 [Candidatus Aenigmarchaeota archaeon]|nr:hypothetical protein [Candidatus Aenigmarchaeota archaeon]